MAYKGTIFTIHTFMLGLKDYGLCTGESNKRKPLMAIMAVSRIENKQHI